MTHDALYEYLSSRLKIPSVHYHFPKVWSEGGIWQPFANLNLRTELTGDNYRARRDYKIQ